MAENFDCIICLDTKNVKEQVCCPFCQIKLCQDCAQRWLLMEKVAYSCPNCKKGWNFSYIYNTFPLNFINDKLKPNYAEICSIIDKQQYLQPFIDKANFCKNIDNVYRILIDNNIKYNDYKFVYKNSYNNNRYISEMPADKLQNLINIYPLVKDYITFDLFTSIFNVYNHNSLYDIYIFYNYIQNNRDIFIEDKYIFDYNQMIVQNYYGIYYNSNKYYNDPDGFKQLFKYLDFNYNTYKCIDILIYIIKTHIGEQANQNINKIKKQERRKTCKCEKDGCKGHLYRFKSQLICNECKNIFCSKCRKEIFPKKIERFEEDKVFEEDNPKFKSYTEEQKQLHTCKQEDIDMVNYLNEKIKNCPKCEEPIEKNGGCDHMWCPKCHTMFNWSDLKITKTTTNPLYFQWLREQGLTPARYNHPDAQAFDPCAEQLSYSNCVKITKEYIPSEYQYKFLNFARLMELKTKPGNESKMDVHRKKYAFGIITEKQYTKYISTLYISKFFIDNYNAIISNTMFMVSDFFKDVNHNHLNIDIDNYINSMNGILKIHNDALTNFNKLYPNFNIQIINNNIIPITMKDNKVIKSKRKLELTITYDKTIDYLDSPIKLLSNNNIEDYINTSLYFLLFYYNDNETKLKYNIHKLFYCFFPNYEILNNNMLYKILSDEKIMSNIFNNQLFNQLNKRIIFTIEKIEQKYKIIQQSILYKKSLYKILKEINFYYRTVGLNEYIKIFKETYNNLIKTLQNYNVKYIHTIYEQDHKDRSSFDKYINRAKHLQNNLHKIYKYNKADLINSLQKNNINISLFVNETIFNKENIKYCLILSMEKDLMNVIKQFL